MTTFEDYTTEQVVYESSYTTIYQSLSKKDNQQVILKKLKDYPSYEEIANFKREFYITQGLDCEGVIKAKELFKFGNTLVMELEDIGGISLDQILRTPLFKKQPIALQLFLEIAIKATDILERIHQKKVIHKDINPSNFVWSPKTKVLNVIDFGISTNLTHEDTTIQDRMLLEGTIAYMSPEQTGRMNRQLDYRTDIYSLGVTFYELLTAGLPFKSDEMMEVIHGHMAYDPLAPHLINPVIPEMISRIVIKAMAKPVEQRYQSMYGLKHDLVSCSNALKTKNTIELFAIGTQDKPDLFQIPQTLYGREQELNNLITGFEAAENGEKQLALVTGQGGIGKTMLIQEYRDQILPQAAFFITGKFEQLKQDNPYSCFIQAFKDLVRQLITGSSAQLAFWKQSILAAVKANGQVLIDVLPELQLVIGPQPEPEILPPSESENRFVTVIQSFFKALAVQKQPFVVFMDDLQWADSDSLNLLRNIIIDDDIRNLQIIGAYRENEVAESHPLQITLTRIKDKGFKPKEVCLQPLSADHICRMIMDIASEHAEKVIPLATLVWEKTHGNPFFIHQFLASLYNDGLFRFDFATRLWVWDQSQIAALDYTDNVIDFIISKIGKLSEKSQDLLKTASCIGIEFNLFELTSLYDDAPAALVKNLWELIADGFVKPLTAKYRLLQYTDESFGESELQEFRSYTFRFLHDRVQDTAFKLLTEAQQKSKNLQVGKIMLEQYRKETTKRDEDLFKMVTHLNIGKEYLQAESEKLELAQLNAISASKANRSSAYQLAYQFAKSGLELLSEQDNWKKHYDLMRQLHIEAINATYLNRDIGELRSLIRAAMSNARNLLDKVEIYEAKIHALQAQNKKLEIIATSRQILKKLGIKLPKNLLLLQFFPVFIQTKQKLKKFSDQDLENLSEMQKPKVQAAMHLLAVTASAAYESMPNLVLYICCKFVQLTLKHGIAPETAYGFSAFGLVLTAMGDIEGGYRYGKLAEKLSERPASKKMKGRTLTLMEIFIRHWKHPWSESTDRYLNAFKTALDFGDIEYAGHSAHLVCRNLYWMGNSLKSVNEEFERFTRFISKTKDELSINPQNTYHQAIYNLRQKEPDFRFKGPYFNEEVKLPELMDRGNFDKSSVFLFFLNKMVLCFLLENNLEAFNTLQKANKLKDVTLGQSIAITLAFYESLIYLARWESLSLTQKEFYSIRIRSNQKKLKNWARFCPANCLNKYHLVEAELLRIKHDSRALGAYAQAIAQARTNGFMQEEALANELVARFYLSSGQAEIADDHLREAVYLYERWGAKAKVNQLFQHYPTLHKADPKTKILKTGAPLSTYISSRESTTSVLDLITILKASHAISSDIILESFLKRMIVIVMENAGAQQAHLILKNKNELLIEASSTIDGDTVEVLRSVPLESRQSSGKPILPVDLINYVVTTGESVVLDDATAALQFVKDPYIKLEQPKSVLCIPIRRQADLTGILYLENSRTTHVFTPDRVELLQMLSAQIAISIENAVLYKKLDENNQSLEQNVALRTAELKEQNHLLQIAREEADKANAAKSEFLANMSHELRTPMHAILGYAKLGTDRIQQIPREKLLEYLLEIKTSGERLLNLLNDLLDLSKMKAGKIAYCFKEAFLASIIQEVASELLALLQKKNIDVVFAKPEFPDRAIMDREKIAQVFRNLLSNAIKFSHQNGRIAIAIEDETTAFLISVKDQGVGIPEKELRLIFEKFTQSSTTDTGAGGTGLGLSICEEIIKQHGGTIWAENNPEGGAVFRFRLPKERPASDSAEKLNTEGDAPGQ